MARLFRTATSGIVLTVALLAAWSGIAASATTDSAPSSAQPSNAAMRCAHGETPAIAATSANGLQPPTGFNPATASDTELTKYGFPPRPKNGGGAGWLAAMRAWKAKASVNSPAWTCGHENHGAAGASRAATPDGLGGSTGITSYQWGGNQVSNYRNGDFYGDYPSASLEMNLPYPRGGNSLYNEATFWTGIGMGNGSGSSGDQLLQNGVEMGQSPGVSYYALFFEVYPQQDAVYVAPFSISSGDLLYFQSWYSGTTAHFYFGNLSHGQSISYTQSFNGASGDSAEWIVEKSGQEALSEWGPDNPFDMRAEFENSNGGWFCAGTANHWSIHLLNSSNQDIAHGLAWVDPPSYCTFPLYRTSADGS